MVLSPAELRERGQLAQQRLIHSAEFAAAGVVALYAPIRNEVDTDDLFQVALLAGKKVIYPAVSGKILVFRQINGNTDLQQGSFGIREPKESCPHIDPVEADLIVVPGVAFDVSGRRVGYGQGYYDRALHHLEHSGKLVGICFEFQLVPEIVAEPHDVLMDRVVTERQLIRCRNSAQ